jgi:hypothetical protein
MADSNIILFKLIIHYSTHKQSTEINKKKAEHHHM